MNKFDELRSVLQFPIESPVAQPWSPGELERVLQSAMGAGVQFCRERNRDKIVVQTLSGGLDSSFGLALIRGIEPKDGLVHTFMITRRRDNPDVWYAKAMAARFGANHHLFFANSRQIANAQDALSKLDLGSGAGLPGNEAVWLVYQAIAWAGFERVIAHDGIDELLGGYLDHRHPDAELCRRVFQNRWERLWSEHLAPLLRIADSVGIQVFFPYLQREVVEYIGKIPLGERTGPNETKIPLRRLAQGLIPDEVITRRKMGFDRALD